MTRRNASASRGLRCSTNAPLLLSVLRAASQPLPQSVTISGTFLSEDPGRPLAESGPHAVFLPAIWPETWSFVLKAALKQGLPMIAFDVGAPAARVRELGRGHVLPSALAADTERFLETLLELRALWVVR